MCREKIDLFRVLNVVLHDYPSESVLNHIRQESFLLNSRQISDYFETK